MTMIRLATRIQPIHVAIGCIGILILVELCRRCVGLPILVVAGLLIVYAFYNQLSYGASFYKALQNIIYKLFYTTSGVIGTPVSVCYTYIVLFIIFGAFLERTGIANFFHLICKPACRLVFWRPGEGCSHFFRAVRHGVRLLGRQHGHDRLIYHPDDEKNRL